MSKTKVRTKNDDQECQEFKKGEEGYVDGYVRGGDNRPYAVVVIVDRLILCHLQSLEVLPSQNLREKENE